MTQRDRVLQALEAAGARGLTGLELFDATGSMRYGARILELREQGHNITAERTGTSKSGAAIFRYTLTPADQLFADQPTQSAPTTAHYMEAA